MSGPPGGTAPHVLVEAVDDPAVDDGTRHHLLRVRRLRHGADLTVTDGAGSWRWCRLRGDGTLEPSGEVERVPRPDPPVTVAFALTKGDKPELVVQKLTEVGVDRIVPFRAARSVVRWDDERAAAHHRRWVAIARGAVAQSRRCWVPEIDPLSDLDDLVGLGAVPVDRGGAPPSLARSVVAVGPEGGWERDERDRLGPAVGLGPLVLRAETAAVTAGVVLCSLRSGLVRETPADAAATGKGS